MNESLDPSKISLYQKLIIYMDKRHQELDGLAVEYESLSRLGRRALLHAHPDLGEHLKFSECQQSIIDARKYTPYDEDMRRMREHLGLEVVE
jgi:hypothetical protein